MDVTAAPVLTRAGATTTVAAEFPRPSRRSPDGADPVRRASGETAATTSAERANAAPVEGLHTPGRSRAEELIPSEVPVHVPGFGKEEGDEPGVLKFDVQDADVLARFAIHEETNHVIVTMYQRDTGEVIKEFPPRQVLDVMAALAGKGLAIDVSS